MDVLFAADDRRRGDDELGEARGVPARDVAPGERWAFVEHRSLAEVIAAERRP